MPGYGNLLRSLEQSTIEPVQAIVKGTIPDWVEGVLYRNGPGRFKFGEKMHQHVFDGGACVHKFKVQDGQVFYSNRLLETNSYKQTLETGRLTPNFGSIDIESNMFGRFKTFFSGNKERHDNTNVNIAPFANEHLYALTEMHLVCKLKPENLEITETVNITNYLPEVSRIFAHPHVEKDGTWITMGVTSGGFNKTPVFKFIKYLGGEKGAESRNFAENGEVIASLPSSYNNGYSYFHSFALTDNYIIFLEQSIMLYFTSYIRDVLIMNKSFSQTMVSDTTLPTRIHVINRHTGERVEKNFHTDSQFTFHCINAYEDKDEIVVDLSSYDSNYFTTETFNYENSYTDKILGSKALWPVAKRIRIPLKSEQDDIFCELKSLKEDLPFEFPIINYSKYNGQRYKYVYGANHFKLPFSVIKLNVDEPENFYEFNYGSSENREIPSEPIFVENPNGSSEDDGVLLVLVLSDKNDYLSVLDAKDLKELARAEIPEQVKSAFTFHGFFADGKTFEKLNV
ncbi:unnamed protein product [Brachionus calyciflorus]|uniref:Uncharacterized protein n=1 Tax=Brachionus calyciflorus TaxID=104777 RepID=A0A813SAU2_9BILA|nr:unnamed protein product [Brachionus calyciflorus]